MLDSLGDRMKANYEDRQRVYLTRRTPVIIRLDGRAFHTLTRQLDKPFDMRLMYAMVDAAKAVFAEIQGCKLSYVQSDEVSFVLTDYDSLNTQAWFDYNKSKIESISAALMTRYFNRYFHLEGIFDARSFNIPESEVANYFLWRAKDWRRNSVQMLAQHYFSHRELQNKTINYLVNVLRETNHPWEGLTECQKFGTFITSDEVLHIPAFYCNMETLWNKVRPNV
jgi:tRNA(His) guanylyltransferase